MKTRRRDDRSNKTHHTFSSSEFTPEFFKVFLPHFSAYQLHIPKAFVYQYKDTIEKNMVLKDINGRLWNVEVIKNEEGYFITKGWENFIMNHALNSGDFLVFRYDGNACFTVKIFGINGCKKEVSTLLSKVKIEYNTNEVIEANTNIQTNCTEPCQERPENDRTNDLEKVTQSRLLRSSSRISKRRSQEPEPEPEPELCKTEMGFLTGSKRGLPQTVGSEKEVTQSRKVTRRRPEFVEPEPEGISETVIDLTGTEEVTDSIMLVKEEKLPLKFVQNTSSRMGTRSRPRKDTVLAETEVPYFIALIDSYNMDELVIPEIIEKTFKVKLNSKVFLCYHKKRWPVMVSKEGESRVSFGKGWNVFLQENKLSVGDRCMFKFGTTKLSDEIEVRVL